MGMARHPAAERWEQKLKAVFDGINDRLERRYGGRYPLHPARAPHKSTANRESDGLFNVGAAFSAGYGSRLGAGYVVQVQMATLVGVPDDVRETIENEVVELLNAELPRAFPSQPLSVERDGTVYKIHGDLSLGTA
jgi:hypothetical protein